MCAIAGFYGARASAETLEKFSIRLPLALSVVSNRGPDASAIQQTSPHCSLGSCRLVVTGSVDDGSFPLKSELHIGGFNGEIYNYRSWDSQARSDSEVVLPLLEELGPDLAFRTLDGEFAVCAYSPSDDTLIVARDPLGSRPLYFALVEGVLLWGSHEDSINALHPHARCTPRISGTYKHSLTIQEPYTSYCGIWTVPPGHYLRATPRCIELHSYNKWREEAPDCDTRDVFAILRRTLKSRLSCSRTVAIPMSAGIDSGIIAFFADYMGVDYEIFSVDRMFGAPTEETDAIHDRCGRLNNARRFTMLDCDDEAFDSACNTIYKPGYYATERLDTSMAPTHTLHRAIAESGIRVSIDGTGGDEAFHGYLFRDDFREIEEWPKTWPDKPQSYSIYSTLLDYTAKAEKSGAFFSIECRFPYQNSCLFSAAMKLPCTSSLKWPLRKFLAEELSNYGSLLEVDKNGKYGFSLKNRDKKYLLGRFRKAWGTARPTTAPLVAPKPFPFKIGGSSQVQGL